MSKSDKNVQRPGLEPESRQPQSFIIPTKPSRNPWRSMCISYYLYHSSWKSPSNTSGENSTKKLSTSFFFSQPRPIRRILRKLGRRDSGLQKGCRRISLVCKGGVKEGRFCLTSSKTDYFLIKTTLSRVGNLLLQDPCIISLILSSGTLENPFLSYP